MLGWGELLLILIAALMLLGPDKMSDFARQLGKLYAEYKKAKRMLELELIYGYKPLSSRDIEDEMKKKYEELQIELKKLALGEAPKPENKPETNLEENVHKEDERSEETKDSEDRSHLDQ